MGDIDAVEDLVSTTFVRHTKDKLYFLDVDNVFHSARLDKVDLLRNFINDEYSIRFLFKSASEDPLVGNIQVSQVDVLYGADLIGTLLDLFDDYFPLALDPSIYYI